MHNQQSKEFEIVTYECGCSAQANRTRFDVWEFCPTHLKQQDTVAYRRRSITGYVEGQREVEKHDPDCAEAIIGREIAIRNYKSTYPNYCTNCQGWGGRGYSYDPSPAGVSLSPGSLWDFDPCPKCAQRGYCPRCGLKTLLDEQDEPTVEVCYACRFKQMETEGIPDVECFCYERHMDGFGPY